MYAKVTSTCLHVLSSDRHLEEAGSCSLVDFRGERIVITVAHNIVDMKTDILSRGGILIGITPTLQTEYYLPSYEYTKNIKLENETFNDPELDLKQLLSAGETVDFAYALIDDKSIQPRDDHHMVEEGKIYTLDKNILATKFTSIPTSEDRYFFYGKVRYKIDRKNLTYQCQERFEDDVQYVATMPGGHFHIFQIQHIIRDFDDFRGCSGAPILNGDGELVSMVAKGYLGKNRILGVNLEYLRPAIEASILSKTKQTHFSK
jgi:hypothetical protein